jgi:hypothetical protein
MDVDVTGLEVDVAEANGTAVLEKLGLGVFGGTIAGSGRVEHGRAPATFSCETAVRGVDMTQVIAAHAPDMASRFGGRLDADWSIAGAAGDEPVVRKSLAGRGHVVIHDGVLRGVNVADAVLSGVTGMGGLATLVPQRVRERHPDIFSTGDTRFDQLTTDVRIGGERMIVESVVVSAKDYAVHGKGFVTFDRYADLTATLTASQPLTKDITGVLKEAEALAGDDGRLAIPFRFAGILPDVKPKPDEEFLARVLRKALIGEGLERLLGGGRKGDGDGKPAGGDKLRRELDKLFGH